MAAVGQADETDERLGHVVTRQEPCEGMTSRTIILTGPPEIGKTTICRKTAELARAQNCGVAGIVTVTALGDAPTVRRWVEDLHTGERTPLAEQRAVADGSSSGRWLFDYGGLVWGAARLRNIDACDLLIIDEIGPLELLRREGWYEAAVELLHSNVYRIGLVVVRPSLVEQFRRELRGKETVCLTVAPDNRHTLPQLIVSLLMEGR